MALRFSVLTVALVLMACAPATTAKQPALARVTPSRRAEFWLTTGDEQARLTPQPPLVASADVAPASPDSTRVRITLAPDSLGQSMLGVGAALTDASAMLLNALPPARRDSLLHALFTPTGAGLSVLRLPVGASDFSTRFYSDADTPGQPIADLSIDDTLRMPLLRTARARNPQLTVLLAAWSAPAWMKTTGSLIGGTLRADAESSYVTYLRSVVDGYAARGIPIYALSLQNEPGFVPADYPGMLLSASQRARLIGRYLGPQLRQAAASGAPRVRILEWDHNWDHPEEPRTVLADSIAGAYVDGVAWHCYAGEVATQRQFHAAVPGVDSYFTECSGGEWAPRFADNLRWNARTLLIGALNASARTLVYWNLALDPQGGPHLGGCANCRGVLTIDNERGTITPNVEYWILAHVGRFVQPGDRRMVSRSSSPEVAVVAFRRTADQGRVVVVLNDAAGPRRIDVVDGGERFTLSLPAGAVATITFPA